MGDTDVCRRAGTDNSGACASCMAIFPWCWLLGCLSNVLYIVGCRGCSSLPVQSEKEWRPRRSHRLSALLHTPTYSKEINNEVEGLLSRLHEGMLAYTTVSNLLLLV